ncbi:MAG: hypothetical protein ACRD3M_18750 [Thermoanaerobaculia bacterium]
MTSDEARQLLTLAGVFYEPDDEIKEYAQTLNMNDVWGWATAWGQYVPDSELPRVGELFYRYGWCGILYWMSEQHEQMRSEFLDVNRFVDFVRQEEKLREAEPSFSKRAYKKIEYSLGSGK